MAVVHLYGSSRVRVFAEQIVSPDEGPPFNYAYSHPVESAADTVPNRIELVLNSRKL
jgi:hypothetical protein